MYIATKISIFRKKNINGKPQHQKGGAKISTCKENSSCSRIDNGEKKKNKDTNHKPLHQRNSIVRLQTQLEHKRKRKGLGG